MKKLFRRACDWLIKKLGGYTSEEYETIAVGVKDVERLRVQMEIAPSEIRIYQNSDLMVKTMTERMMPLIRDRMRIRRLVDGPTTLVRGDVIVEGYITIVKEE